VKKHKRTIVQGGGEYRKGKGQGPLLGRRIKLGQKKKKCWCTCKEGEGIGCKGTRKKKKSQKGSTCVKGFGEEKNVPYGEGR